MSSTNISFVHSDKSYEIHKKLKKKTWKMNCQIIKVAYEKCMNISSFYKEVIKYLWNSQYIL